MKFSRDSLIHAVGNETLERLRIAGARAYRHHWVNLRNVQAHAERWGSAYARYVARYAERPVLVDVLAPLYTRVFDDAVREAAKKKPR